MMYKIELLKAGKIMSQSERTGYEWDTINWNKIQRSVFKLQKRIYQASKNNDLKGVHSLQRLLLTSKSAKLTPQESQEIRAKTNKLAQSYLKNHYI